MSLPFNNPEGPVSLVDLLALLKKDIFLSFNCHALGTIFSFDANEQTAQVNLNYVKTLFNDSGVQRSIEYPALVDVPVIILSGGTTYLNMPISKGDQCLVMFNDRDIDNWFDGATAGHEVNTPRLHSLADGIALVGLQQFAISGYDAVRAMLTDGTVMVGINPDTSKVLISNGTTLNDLLQDLITEVKNLVTATAAITVIPGSFVAGATPVTGVSGVPVNAATITAIGTALTSTASDIGDLLE